MGKFLLIGLIGLGIIGAVVSMSVKKDALPPAVATEPPKPSAEELAKQPKRMKLIEDAQNAGLIGDVTFGRYPSFKVKPKFYLLPFDTKQTTAAVILAYAKVEAPEAFAVTLYDYLNGKEVGRCSKDLGLKME